MTHRIQLTVNGEEHDLLIEPRKTLLSALRDQIGITGTKEGCSTGDCGACTVLVDGKPTTSCLMLAVQADGKEITTIEGIMEGSELHPVQKAMVKLGGFQCGFCTPGIIVSGVAHLDQNPSSTDDEIREALAGNLCRCTGYWKIIEAMQEAAKEMRRRNRRKAPRKRARVA